VSDVGRSLGEHIALLRRAQQMSQRELAEAIGVTRTSVSSWENGRSRPRPSQLEALRVVLGGDPGLVGGDVFDQPVSVADLQRQTGEALIRQLVDDEATEDPTRYGWRHDMDDPGQPVTALATAYGLQAVLLAVGPDRRISLPRIRQRLRQLERSGGWSARSGSQPRPEVSAVVIAALQSAGEEKDYVASHARRVVAALEESEGTQWSRPYVLATTLLELAGLTVDDTAGRRLVDRLVGMSTETGEGVRAWPVHVKSRSDLADLPKPSTAHTAIAVCALVAWARRLGDERMRALAGAGGTWLERYGDLALEDEWYSDGDDPLIPVCLFTPAWVLRAVIECGGGETGHLAERALRATLACYRPKAALWEWTRHGGMVPVWMTCQGLAALIAWGGARQLA
jgi:transcriptional regulator with XRE-family HTH domain